MIKKAENAEITKSMRSALCCVGIVSLLGSVGFAQTEPPASIQVQNADSKRMSEPGRSFESGDALRVRVFPDTNSFVNGIYPIDGNGDVDFPIIGKVRVINKAPDSLVSMLKEAYITYLRYPNVQVSPLMRLAFVGGFYKPGLYYVAPTSTLFQSMVAAGGTQREDGVLQMRLERDRKVIKSNLVADFQSGQSVVELGYRSGDQICVIQRPIETSWEKVRNNLIPVLSFALSAVSTTATLYLTYESYKVLRTPR